jgi:hypothetical protein
VNLTDVVLVLALGAVASRDFTVAAAFLVLLTVFRVVATLVGYHPTVLLGDDTEAPV